MLKTDIGKPMSTITATRPKQQSYKGIVRLLTPGPVFEIHNTNSYERASVESYISEQFEAAHGAKISEYMPDLLTMRCAGNLSGAAGIRFANDDALFLERYLSNSIEQTISDITGLSAERHSIVEIGNLVASHRGSSQLLFILLTAILNKVDCQWAVFTATPIVEKLLRKLGLELYTLAEASPSSLGAPKDIDNWGSYYQSKPKVFCVSPAPSLKALKERKILSSILALYQSCVITLAEVIDSGYKKFEQYALTA